MKWCIRSRYAETISYYVNVQWRHFESVATMVPPSMFLHIIWKFKAYQILEKESPPWEEIPYCEKTKKTLAASTLDTNIISLACNVPIVICFVSKRSFSRLGPILIHGSWDWFCNNISNYLEPKESKENNWCILFQTWLFS